MATLPLGVAAYLRKYSGEPEIKLVNRFLEVNPANLKEKIALLSRCGTTALSAFAGGNIRGTYSKLGLFDGALFVVSGPNLWRYDTDGTQTAITGVINGTGHPEVTWQKGIGYERLFIADGLLLQYYDGGSQATGTLTLAGGAITNQVVEIGGIYYSWNAAVDTNAPDGTSAHPWLANPGSDPLTALANLIDFNGTRGVDFSTALGGPSTLVTASATDPSASGTLTLSGGPITNQIFQIGNSYYSWNANVDTGAPDGSSAAPWLALLGASDSDSLANMVKLINFTGTSGVDYSSNLAAASHYVTATSTATTLVATALDPGTSGNATATSVFSGSFLSWGAATLTGGADAAATLKVTAISQFADGNAITTTVFSGSFLSWSSATLTGGGVHTLQGVLVPDGVGIKALAEVSGYVLASVANSQKFFFILPAETTIDPLNFAEKESNPDNIVDMLTVGDQVLITGQGSTENWYASGDPLTPLLPVEGRVYARGTIDGTTVVVNDSVILVGNDGIVYQIEGAGVTPISNPAISERIRTELRREQGLS